MKWIFYILLLVTLTLHSCKSKENTIENESLNHLFKQEKSTIFFFFKANHDTIELQKTKSTDSKVKGIFVSKVPKEQWKNNYWLVSFENQRDKQIQLQIEDPFIENYEVFSRDGNVEKGRIKHDSTQFILSIPLMDSIKSIKFEKIKKEHTTYKLETLGIINPNL